MTKEVRNERSYSGDSFHREKTRQQLRVNRSNKKTNWLNTFEGKVLAMSPDLDYLIQKEKFQDLIREAEQERLLRTIELQNDSQRGLHRNLAAWVGHQMVRWGSKLQHYGSVSAAAASSAATQNEYLPN
jgi:ABC-type phosphonate transport system ATPase subunit